jgi:HK97 gp10 family phage protein
MGYSVSVVGVDKVQRRLSTLAKLHNTKRAIKWAAFGVSGTAKAIVPVDTGALRTSIHASVSETMTEIVGKVATSLEYAPYIEFGTGSKGGSEAASKLGLAFSEKPGQIAQPFLYPALKQNEQQIRSQIHAALVADMKGV